MDLRGANGPSVFALIWKREFPKFVVKEAEFPPPRAARFVYDVRAVTLVIAEDGYSFSRII